MRKDNRRLMVDSFTCANYHVCNESEVKEFRNESSFQAAWSNIEQKDINPECLAVIEGRWTKNCATSVNGRYYCDNFWDKQLEKEQTQFLLRKGLMWMMMGHVDRGIEDKDAEKGLIAGIVTHLKVIKQPCTIHGKDYEPGDLFGRAIIINMDAGKNVYTLLANNVDLSISSRGLGEYIIGETYQTEDGQNLPIMNPDTYELETFDFTRLPGIGCAEVHMVKDNKHPENQLETNETNDEFDFDNESLEIPDKDAEYINESLNSLIFNINQKENHMAKVDPTKLQTVLEEANAKIAKLTAQLEDAEQERDDAKAKADELEKKLDEKEPATETVEAGTQPEDPAENPAPVKAEVTKEPAAEPEVDMSELAEFKALADSPKELEATMTTANEELIRLKEENDKIADIEKERDDAKAEVEAKDKELNECKQALESYINLGSIQELSAMVESNKSLKAEARKQKLQAFVECYSVKKGITQESVKRIIESSKSIKAAKSVLESLPNVSENKGLFRKTESAEINPKSQVTSEFKTFAESYIAKAEASRQHKSYTV